MSHYFDSGVMFGENAWHGLGTVLPADDARRLSVAGTLGAAGIDVEYVKLPLGVAADPSIPAEIRGAGLAGVYGVFRSSDWAHVGTVKEGYRVMPPRRMLEWFQPFLDAGVCSFETAGSLKGGKIIWALARIGGDNLTIGKETIGKYIQISTSYDGSLATQLGFCGVRTVCWNTLSANLGSKHSKLLSIRHTAQQFKSLEAVREVMDLATQSFEASAVQYRRLMATGISPGELRKYVSLVLQATEEESAVSARMSKAIDRIVTLAYSGKGQDGSLSAWSAYNGVTEYLAHERQKDTSSRLASLWYGDSKRMNDRALALALQLSA